MAILVLGEKMVICSFYNLLNSVLPNHTMSKITRDLLWKSIIEDLFEPFLYFFFNEFVNQIDFSREFDFLDKELQTLSIESDSKNRRADKLVKVWLKNGEEKWILIHTEVQGYSEEEFSLRVYNMYTRIRDKYGRPVAVLIIYTDDNSNFHPKEFREKCFGTTNILKFQTFKVLENPPEFFSNSENIFAQIMEIVWYELKKNKLSDENYLNVGKKIVWGLARKGLDNRTIFNVFEFIRHYVTFEKSEIFNKFSEEINSVLKIQEGMGIYELLKKHKEEEILEQGREQGREQGLEQGLELVFKVSQLYKNGISAEDIAKQLEVKLQIINKIIQKL